MPHARASTRLYTWILIAIAMGLLLIIIPIGRAAPPLQVPSGLCDDVRYLMENDTTPLFLMPNDSDGTLTPRQPVNGSISPTDMGDFWAFSVTNEEAGLGLVFDVDDIPVPVEYAVFQGMDLVRAFQRITTGAPYAIELRETGLYTVAVRLVRASDLQQITRPLTYTITAQFDGSGNVQPRIGEVTDAANRGTALPAEFVNGVQTISQFPANGARVEFHADSVLSGQGRQGISSEGGNIRLIFAPGQTIIINSWAQRVSATGGDLAVAGTVDGQSRTFYLEDYGYASDITRSGFLDNVIDSNGTTIRTDWQDITGIWVLRGCAGYKLADGRTFVTSLDSSDVDRDVIFEQATTNEQRRINNQVCSASYVSVNIGESQQQICFDWRAIEPLTEVSFENGVLDATFVDNRALRVESQTINMLPFDSVSSRAESFPVAITLVNDPITTIQLDWDNMTGFSLANGELGLSFADPVRAPNTTIRNGIDAVGVDAIDGVVRIQYASTEARLLLPAEESYIEIVTPAGEPTFAGAPFNARALPGEAGYQPRMTNNLGGECYPINTLQPEANCAPNGHINPTNGNLWYGVTDLLAAGPVLDLALIRSYNSGAATVDGAFGLGWSFPFPFDYNVTFDPTTNSRQVAVQGYTNDADATTQYRVGLDLTWTPRGLVEYTTGSGSRHAFTLRNTAEDGSQTFIALTMPGWFLTRAGLQDNWTLTQDSGFTLTFDRAGRLRRYGYPALNREVVIDYEWDTLFDGPGSGKVDSPVIISDAATNRRIELYFDTNHHIVRSILCAAPSDPTEPCERSDHFEEVRYEYSGNLLTRVTYPDGQVAEYAYDEAGAMVWHNDPRAPVSPTMAYAYFPNSLSVAAAYILDSGQRQATDDSFVWRRLNVTDDGGTRTVTVAEEYVDEAQAVIREYRYTLSDSTWDTAGTSYRLAGYVGPLARNGGFDAVPQTYTWDTTQTNRVNGLIYTVNARNENGRRNPVTFTYTETGRLQSISTGRADVVGHPGMTITQQQLGSSSVPIYLPERVRFADGSQIAYTYDDSGRVTTMRDGFGARYTYTWADGYQLIRVTLQRLVSDGDTTDDTSDDIYEDVTIWNYSYHADSLGMVASITEIAAQNESDDGYRVDYEWDAFGRLVTVTDSILGTYLITYNQADSDTETSLSIVITDPTGATTETAFDARGRRVAVIMRDADGMALRHTVYRYDYLDRLIDEEQVSQLQLPDAESEARLITTYTYSPVPTFTNTAGETEYIGGHSITITDPHGRRQTVTYDALGRVRQTLDYFQNEQRFDYFITNANDGAQSAANPGGLRIVQQDRRGGQLTAEMTYIFDGRWQLVNMSRSTYTQNGEINWTGRWQLYRNSTDLESTNPRRLEGPGFRGLDWATNAYVSGQPADSTLTYNTPNPTEVMTVTPDSNLDYDYLGRPTRITQIVDETELVTTIAYCPLSGGRERIIRSRPNTFVSCDDDANAAIAITYDVHGRIIRHDESSGSRIYSYTAVDGLWRVTIVGVSASAYTWTLDYNAAGDLTQWDDDSGQSRIYVYDTLGRLRQVETTMNDEPQPEASYTFTYNGANLLSQQQDTLGRGTIYEYNAQGQVTVEQDISTSNATIYTYDSSGLLTAVISPDGVTTTYFYDGSSPGRLTGISTPFGRHEFAWDNATNTMTYTDPRGNSTSYAYDIFGQLWRIEGELERRYTVNYDDIGRVIDVRTFDGDESRHLQLTHDAPVNSVTIQPPDMPSWSWGITFTPSGGLQIVNSPASAVRFTVDGFGRLSGIEAGNRIWSFNRVDGESTANFTDDYGLNTSLTFDALYREVQNNTSDDTVTYRYQSVEGQGDDSSYVNLLIGRADSSRIYTFSPGDGINPPTVVLRAPGRRVVYIYDAEGLLTEISSEICLTDSDLSLDVTDLSEFSVNSPSVCPDAAADSPVQRSTVRFVYDDAGRPIRVIDAEQNVESFTYNETGNLTIYQNAAGQTYTYTYDSLNRLSSVSGPTGVRVWVDYVFDRVANICQTRSEEASDFETCVENGIILESYSYDTLGRLTGQSYPNITADGETAQNTVTYRYGTEDSIGLPIDWGVDGQNGVELRYADDAGTIESLTVPGTGAYTFSYLTTNRINAVAMGGQDDLRYVYDEQGRVQQIVSGEQIFSYRYLPNNRGYVVQDEQSGYWLRYERNANGMLRLVDYGQNDPDDTPLLSASYSNVDDLGSVPLALDWTVGLTTEMSITRSGLTRFVLHQYFPSESTDTDFDLLLNYTLDPLGQVIRQVIRPQFSDSADIFDREASGYLIIQEYAQDNRPLLLRINDTDSGRLLYLQTFNYSDFGQLTRETRQYESGAQIVIDYTYANRNQLVERHIAIVDMSIAGHALSFTIALTTGLGGLWWLRRKTFGRIKSIIVVAVGIASVYVIIMPMTLHAQTASPSLTYRYTYDAAGNMTQITLNDDVCATYTYDTANRLIIASLPPRNITQIYQYDAYNRLSAINGTQIVYQGNSDIPLARYGDDPTIYAQTADGFSLFQATGNEIIPLIHNGRDEIFTTTTITHPLWLFDPMGRYVDLSNPPTLAQGCGFGSTALDLNLLSPPQTVFQGMMWDSVTNLYFHNGRVYAPQPGRYLQRDPLGPNTNGDIYDYPAQRDVIPIRPTMPAYLDAPTSLHIAMNHIRTSSTLTADAIRVAQLPQPNGMMDDATSDLFTQSTQRMTQWQATLNNLPTWLAHNYNLPAPRIDPMTGGILLLPDNAPGQGGWGDAPSAWYDEAIWQDSDWLSPAIPLPQTAISTFMTQASPPIHVPTSYLPDLWHPNYMTIHDVWLSSAPILDTSHTPAAILEQLPLPFTGYGTDDQIPYLVQMLFALPEMTAQDWVNQGLDYALPTAPDLPPLDAEAWRDDWFTTDTFGTENLLSQRWPVPSSPYIPAIHIAADSDWLGAGFIDIRRIR